MIHRERYATWDIFEHEIAKCDGWIKVVEICIIYVYVDFKLPKEEGLKET